MTAKMKKCKFCGQELSEDKAITVKTSTCICPDCVEICSQILKDRSSPQNSKNEFINLKPIDIKKKLDEYIIEQETAKKIISVAVYNHYKRITHKSETDIQKSNIALIGPTGCGKTLIAKTISKLLGVPIVIADATGLTRQGYVGRSVEDILQQLLQNADNNIDLAEKGIIFIDEIDKIAGDGSTGGKDIAGAGVQQSLLKMVEGTTVQLPVDDKLFDEESNISINTKNILFIFGGSFAGIEKIIATRMNKVRVGFGANTNRIKEENEKILKNITHEDLIKFGMIPEFVGRIAIIATLSDLNESALIRILQEPKDALVKQYTELMKFDGIDLKFEDAAIKKIANIAMSRKAGARGLRSIIEDSILDIMYTAPSKNIKNVIIKDKDIIDSFTLTN